jgi:hypothetical protein
VAHSFWLLILDSLRATNPCMLHDPAGGKLVNNAPKIGNTHAPKAVFGDADYQRHDGPRRDPVFTKVKLAGEDTLGLAAEISAGASVANTDLLLALSIPEDENETHKESAMEKSFGCRPRICVVRTIRRQHSSSRCRVHGRRQG